MSVLQTERLIMRYWKQEDSEKVAKIWGNTATMKYCAGAMTDELIKNVVNSYIRFQEENDYSIMFPIELKENKDIVGVCGFQKTQEKDVFEFMYHFREDTWGKGYASEAASTVLDYGIDKLKPKKIIAGAAIENIGSLKILEKLNFTFLEEKWFDDTQMNGRYYELKVN
ncbi:GNAT family N-acetyltransferase [Bacillus sp. RG28]|uniref:GNAT family N-acetyltransferase n=1 Tax=Gottfriedia endophytica TaxID=2820819 RepID=A0A940NT34_9BACI|nr:GNAT family N-acetyltransferase [Gottfriedia endophytica]MBP0726547.1 GNAT family N-acetyltransferase [Gottfriedia endophytica]